MTLSIAWVRAVGDTQELVMASDSRLRMGGAWDCAPKILPLPRSDSAISFAGHTYDAYPLMLQMANAISSFPRSRSRAMDLCDMKGHTIRVFNHMRDQFHDLPTAKKNPDPPGALFLLGGYSWKKERFYIWLLHFDPQAKKFTYRPSKLWKGVKGHKQIYLTGNHVDEAKHRIINLLRGRKKLTVGGFDMEPFEVLRDMIREKKYPEIGGPPQMLKIYRHMNTRPYAIYWPDRNSMKISYLGRPLLDYENPEYGVFNPDSLEIEKLPSFNNRQAST